METWKHQEQFLRGDDDKGKTKNRLLHEDINHDEYFSVASDDSIGCLTVQGSNAIPGASLTLGTCGGYRNHMWKYDLHGMFRSMLNETMCMQAGHDGTAAATPKHGTKMRLYPCDMNSDLQQFDYIADIIRLRHTNLCVVFRGINGNVNVDAIILKPCSRSEGQDEWSPDFPEEILP